MELKNQTPFMAERIALQSRDGRDVLVVMVKGTFRQTAAEQLAPDDEQLPIQMADEYYGGFSDTSIKYESDIVPFKKNTDVILIGDAYAPGGRATQVDVVLAVGSLRHTVRVFGDRFWQKGLLAPKISPPLPFEKIPLRYEFAFGGRDLSHEDEARHEQEPRNPVGLGFRARRSKRELYDTRLPNLEDPSVLIEKAEDRPAPSGFGVLGRYWQPRATYAGTADEAWMKTRCPLVPEDFDERYYNGAHPKLVYQGFLGGGETVTVLNASEEGRCRFALPARVPQACLVTAREKQPVELKMDTLIVEPAEGKAIVVWRGLADLHNRLHQIMQVKVEL
jgi:hypothetical protein